MSRSIPKPVLLAGVALLALSAEASAETVEVTASALNVRSGPSTGYRVIGVARNGERFQTLGASGSWVKLDFRGSQGWAYGSYLRTVATSGGSQPSGPSATVTASTLNVRSGPGTNYRIIGSLSRGASVQVVRSSGSWYEVALRSGTGWVHGAYLDVGGGRPGAAPPPSTSRAGYIQLPSSGNGYYGYYAASKRWGTPAMVYGIQRIASRFKAANPSAPRIGVGDISLMNGGPISGHASHQRGVDADLRPVRNDGREAPVTIHQSAYSRTLTQRVLDLFVAEVRVTHIFFNDSRTRHTQHWPNHDNHFHVRIR